MRLDKFLADMGVGTRSSVKQYIKKGLVTVNGEIAKSPDIKIDETKDTVTYEGEPLKYAKFRYFLLNKPAGCVTAVKDYLHPTVMDILSGENTRDLSPVGRLDLDTEGLLLITNDGDLAHHLLSPGHHVEKTYYAEIDGLVTEQHVLLFSEGLDIGDKRKTLPAQLRILETDEHKNTSAIELTITEGRFHQVKRMFEAVDMHVTFLRRIAMGPLRLDDNLSVGAYRPLTDEEVQSLKS